MLAVVEDSTTATQHYNEASDITTTEEEATTYQQQLNDPTRRLELQRLIEQCFMLDGIAKYPFLLNRVDSEFFIPVEDLLFLDPVKSITDDIEFVIATLRNSKLLCLSEDENFVRPDMNVERNVMILRDISSECPPEEVLSIFDHQSQCAIPINLRSDIGNTWFATFESEEECTSTLMVIRTRNFQGHPIKCGIKSGSVFGNFFAASTAALAQEYYASNPTPSTAADDFEYDGRRGGARSADARRRNKTVPSGGGVIGGGVGGKPYRKRFTKNRRESVPNLLRPQEPERIQPTNLTADDFPALTDSTSVPVASVAPTRTALVDIVRRMSGDNHVAKTRDESCKNSPSESQIASESDEQVVIMSDSEGADAAAVSHGRIPGGGISSRDEDSSTSYSNGVLRIAESVAGEPSFEFKDLQEDALIRPSSAPPSQLQPANPPPRSVWGSSSVSYAAILKRSKLQQQEASGSDSPAIPVLKQPTGTRVSKTAADLLRERDA